MTIIYSGRIAAPRRPWGFTLIELLVVIAIIGLLLALLLPAVQQIRESARRTQCRNHLKQIGLALENYHSTHQVFPPASIREPGFEDNGRDRPRTTWMISLLPFIDQAPLYQTVDMSLTTDDPANASIRTTMLASYLCPTDIGSEAVFEPRLGITYRRSNYAASFGAGSWGINHWKQSQYRGVMGQNASVNHAGITDGASNTVSAGEVRIQASPRDNRGVWAFHAPGASSVGLDCDSYCRSINGHSNSDWIPYCDPMPNGLECTFQNTADSNAGPRSRHVGGAHLLFCDGSVRFVNELMDQMILNAIFTSQHHEAVSDF
jgi:prepilin-type N-terminal cleavage/methylation domain-containing protein/prepilin-type processing-associated H-X9-DG protein